MQIVGVRRGVIEKHRGLDELPHIARAYQAGEGDVALAVGIKKLL